MSQFQDFISQIDQAGIVIEGRDKFIKAAEVATNWPGAVTDMALIGRKDGIRLTRATADHPAVQEIDSILRGYPFTEDQRNSIVDNVITVS